MSWQQLFQDTWQTIMVFFALLVCARLLGKTQVGQLTFYEYVSGITIGSLAGNIMAAGSDRLWSHLYDLFLFVTLAYIISHVTLISRPLRKLIEGRPTVVIENGKILRENMREMRYDLDELNAQLREKGILDITEVQYAILENNGAMSVVQKPEFQPVTRGDLRINNIAAAKYPVELIMDGEVVEENFTRQYSRQWLMNQLQAKGFADPADVMYAVVDSKGNFFACSKAGCK
jgi:uncharacterized membrane protein YcaP (DUF421 family)